MITNFSNSTIPQPLKIVAYLFIAGGILSVMDTLVELMLGRLNLNLGVLMIFIGRGLLRFNPRSLAWAVFFTWLGLIFLPIAAVVSLSLPVNFQVFGLTVGQMPHAVCFILCAAMFALYYWQNGVLKSRQVRRLFRV